MHELKARASRDSIFGGWLEITHTELVWLTKFVLMSDSMNVVILSDDASRSLAGLRNPFFIFSPSSKLGYYARFKLDYNPYNPVPRQADPIHSIGIPLCIIC